MKKFLSLLLLASLVLVAIPVAHASEVIEIEMWTNMYTEDNELPGLLKEYEEAHPNVKVNLLSIAFWDFNSKLNPALAAGTAPDLFIGSLDECYSLAVSDLTADITDLLIARGYDESKYMPFTQEACKMNGRYYGIPFATDTRLLYYNKDMFAAAGSIRKSRPRPGKRCANTLKS